MQNKNLLASLIEADGDLEETEKNMLMETREKVGLVVPMKMQMVDALTQELTANLVEEIEEIKSSSLLKGKHLLWPME